MLNYAQETWEQVATRIAACEGPVAWAWFAALERGEWRVLGLTVRGATALEHSLDRYAAFVLSTEELTPVVAADRFRAGEVRPGLDPRLRVGPISDDAATWWLTTERVGSRLLPNAWPRYSAEFHIRTDTTPNVRRDEPLVAAGERFHSDVMTAVSEMIYGVPPEVLGNNLSPAVHVILPDRRARFGDITFAAGRTEVAVEEGTPGSAAGLLLRASWRDNADDDGWRRVDVPIVSAGVIEVPTDVVPAHMSLIIASESGVALDRRSWSPQYGSRPIHRDVPSEQVERWLSEGEHETLEFKREIDTPSAKRSFAQVVCAFANGAGGTVLLGVDDDRTVRGYERPFPVADHVQNIARNSIDGPTVVHVQSVVARAVPIFVVSVEPSPMDGKPHMVDGEVWLRAGGTTFRARPEEIRRLVAAPHPRNGLFGPSG